MTGEIGMSNRMGPSGVAGDADLVDGTPVLDVKPYIPLYDTVPPDALRLPGPASSWRLLPFPPWEVFNLRGVVRGGGAHFSLRQVRNSGNRA